MPLDSAATLSCKLPADPSADSSARARSMLECVHVGLSTL